MNEMRTLFTHSTPSSHIGILALRCRLQLPVPNLLQGQRRTTVILSIFTQSHYLRLMSPAPNGIGWHCEVSCVHWVTGNKRRWRECKERCGAAWWEEWVGIGQREIPTSPLYSPYILTIPV